MNDKKLRKEAEKKSLLGKLVQGAKDVASYSPAKEKAKNFDKVIKKKLKKKY